MNPFEELEEAQKGIVNTRSMVKLMKPMKIGESLNTGYVGSINGSRMYAIVRQILQAKKHKMQSRDYDIKTSQKEIWIKRVS